MAHDTLTAAAVFEAGGEPPSMGDLPMVVLTATHLDVEGLTPAETEAREAELATWITLQKDIASRSTRTRWEARPEAGHMISWEEPEVVQAAILEIVDAVRAPPSPGDGDPDHAPEPSQPAP